MTLKLINYSHTAVFRHPVRSSITSLIKFWLCKSENIVLDSERGAPSWIVRFDMSVNLGGGGGGGGGGSFPPDYIG